MGSTTFWSSEYVGAGLKTCHWYVPSGCTADSLYVKRESGSSTYVYWRDGSWKLGLGQSTTYAVSGTSGSETFFSGGTTGGNSYVTVRVNYHTVEGPSNPSASNISGPASDSTLMSTVTLSNSTMNIASQGLIHRVTWSAGSWSVSAQTSSGATSISQNISDSISYFPSSSSYVVTVSCQTYNSAMQAIGSATSTNFIVTIPQNDLSKPSLSFTSTINPATQTIGGRNITGRTIMHLSGGATLRCYATLASVRITGPGVDTTITDPATGINVNAVQNGPISFTAVATDSRGYTSDPVTTQSYNFVSYTSPALVASASRCNASGNADELGQYVQCTVSFSYHLFNDSISPDNSALVQFYYSSDGGATWSTNPIGQTTVSGSSTVLQIDTGGGFARDHEYKIKAVLSDAVGSTVSSILSIYTAGVFMRWDHNHNAFGFGGYPSRQNSVYVNADWELYTHGQEIIDLIHPIGSIYISINDTSPATLFPGTYWRRISGRYLIAAGAPNANDDNSIGSITGGWNAIAGTKAGGDAHSHATQNHTLTISEIPQHYHGMLDWWNTSYTSGGSTRAAVAVNGDGSGSADVRNNRSRSDGVIQSASNMTVRTGTNIGQPHNHGATETAWNLTPYFAVNMWLRVATAEEAATDI